jgi:hypothetical protein
MIEYCVYCEQDTRGQYCDVCFSPVCINCYIVGNEVGREVICVECSYEDGVGVDEEA